MARHQAIVRILYLFLLATAACTPVGRQPATGTPPAGRERLSSNTPIPATPPVTPTPGIIFSAQQVFEAELGKPYGLAFGQIALFPAEQLEITYLRIVEDSRCPERTDCEWPGELVIEYKVVENGMELGTFAIGSHGTGRVIDDYVVNIWDWDGEAIVVRPHMAEMARSTSAASPHNCTPGAGPSSGYVEPGSMPAETHIVGVYDTGRWPSVANFYVEREGVPLTLVLSAYRDTAWRIHPAENVMLEQIILNGHGQQQAVGIDEVPVLDRSGAHEEGYIVAAACRWGSEDTQALVAEIEASTGRPVTAFYGCYEGSQFTIS